MMHDIILLATICSLQIAAGMSNAIMDIIDFHYDTSIFSDIKDRFWLQWFSPSAWANKWKDGDFAKGEKFWGSSRWFVFVTDAWHFFKTLFLVCMFVSIGLTFLVTNKMNIANALLAVFAMILCYALSFTLFFNRVFTN